MKNAIYEQYRETGKIIVNRTNKVVYPPHFHISVEVCIINHGRCAVSSNGKFYEMTEGSVAFFAPYDTHTYISESFSITNPENYVIIIPPEYAEKFLATKNDFSPIDAVVNNKELCNRLSEIARNYLSHDYPKEILDAAVELFFSFIYQSFTFVKSNRTGEHALIRELLGYILAHYKENINLNTTAKSMGYTPSHLSRVFHSYFGIRITDHINNLRMRYIENERELHPEKKLINLIFEAGYGSIQTYYRNKSATSTTL